MRSLRMWLLAVGLLGAPGCLVREIDPIPPGAEIVSSVPPAEQLEIGGVAPSPAHLWIRGHWVWRGAWIWAPGRWEVRREGYLWHHGYWVRHRHGYVWIEGRWGR